MVAYFSKLISTAHSKFVPLTKIDRYKLIIPEATLNKMKYRNQLRRRWQRNRWNHTLKKVYKTLAKQVEEQISLFRNNAWSTNLEKMNKTRNNSRLWRFVRILNGDSKTIPPIKEHGNFLLTNPEKCEALKAHFENANNTTIQTKSSQERLVKKKTLDEFNNFHSLPAN